MFVRVRPLAARRTPFPFPRRLPFLSASPRLPLWSRLASRVWGGAFLSALVCGFGVMAECRPPPPPFDADLLRADLETLLASDPSLGPLFVRLAWHAAGSWDCRRRDGAPNTAAMRFSPECDYAHNRGLDGARRALEPLKARHPKLTYADLWTLAAVVAVDAMGGPTVPWRYGRRDAVDGSGSAVEDRLPDGAHTQAHVREVFTRMGFNDAETVALIGAHTCGECHRDRSGFVGPWTHDKYGFDNSFFTELFGNEWVLNPEVAQLQFKDRATGKLMMLPTDIALLLDEKYRAIAKRYAEDNDVFCDAFAKAYQKLLELGTKDLKALPPSKA